MTPLSSTPSPRDLSAAERYTPELLQTFLLRLEDSATSDEVWRLMVAAGRSVALPFVDYVSAAGRDTLSNPLFQRSSYEADWLAEAFPDEVVPQWSILGEHASRHLAPRLVGLEFIDESPPASASRRALLDVAATHGMRAGLSIPLCQHAPPHTSLLVFSGDHSRRDMRAIVRAHGWALHVIAILGHQRYLHLFRREFFEGHNVTDKQRALLELIGQGLRDKQIAGRLDISVSAVRQRMSALSARTGLSSRAEMAALAMSLGILPDPIRSDTPDGSWVADIEGDDSETRSRVAEEPSARRE